MDKEAQKREAGEAAADLVVDGMVVGLGTGSTVRYTIEALGRRVAQGLRIRGVPTSEASHHLAAKLGIPLTTLDEDPRVDITIDGADEFDPHLQLIKGGGAALTREKIVAAASARMVVVADASKQVERLGSTFALPVEVLEFAKRPVQEWLEERGARVALRVKDGRPVRTDSGNVILDARWPSSIEDPVTLEAELDRKPGVVCSGLFIGLCHAVYVAGPDGVKVISR